MRLFKLVCDSMNKCANKLVEQSFVVTTMYDFYFMEPFQAVLTAQGITDPRDIFLYVKSVRLILLYAMLLYTTATLDIVHSINDLSNGPYSDSFHHYVLHLENFTYVCYPDVYTNQLLTMFTSDKYFTDECIFSVKAMVKFGHTDLKSYFPIHNGKID